MTIAQVEGGLGSQMFGYAAARRLALVHGAEVLIDARNYRTYEKFQLELGHLDVAATLLSDAEADEICGVADGKLPVVSPAHLHVDRRILDLPTPHVLMKGNYVSEDYFADVADTIRADFRRVTPPTPYAVGVQAHLDELRARGRSPVAVHVRRGDYVTEAHTRAFHGGCSPEYYATAMRLVARLVPDPWFVFFSNDAPWIAEHLPGEHRTTTAPPEGTPPVEDMMLMAACDHHVIANSSYSWWGAWLARHDDQVVVGPRPFIAERSFNTDDVLPRHWISLGAHPRP